MTGDGRAAYRHHDSFKPGDRVRFTPNATNWSGVPLFAAGEPARGGVVTRTQDGWPWEHRVHIDGGKAPRPIASKYLIHDKEHTQ